MLHIFTALLFTTATATMPPHIISILQDDLGFFDSGVHNPISEQWTQNITSLAKQGVVLNYHYSHWHCSPSRRSFLTGRLPIHHGEQLSSNSAPFSSIGAVQLEPSQPRVLGLPCCLNDATCCLPYAELCAHSSVNRDSALLASLEADGLLVTFATGWVALQAWCGRCTSQL